MWNAIRFLEEKNAGAIQIMEDEVWRIKTVGRRYWKKRLGRPRQHETICSQQPN
jgi:hypothetical protein